MGIFYIGSMNWDTFDSSVSFDSVSVLVLFSLHERTQSESAMYVHVFDTVFNNGKKLHWFNELTTFDSGANFDLVSALDLVLNMQCLNLFDGV